MSVHYLPEVVLQHIFKNLCGGDVLECRKVCSRWEEAVDGLSDEFWKETCAKEHCEVYQVAYRKAKLSWRELYISLSLWSDVATADIRITLLPGDNGEKFQLLSNLTIACSYRGGDTSDYGYDTIVYYDLTTLQEHHRESYDFTFMRFEENDHFIVMEIDDEGLAAAYIHVILKSTKKKFVYGKGVCSSSWSWRLYENNIYLQCGCQFYKHIYRGKVVEQNNDVTLVTDDIKYSGNCLYIKGITNMNQQINIIANDGRIYSLIDKEMKLLCSINIHNDDELKQALDRYGFGWQCLDIFDNYTFAGSPIKISYSYGKTVIINDSGNFPQTIDIYYVLNDNPYDNDGEVTYNMARPTKSIDLSVMYPNNKETDLEIRQIAVVETLNGHKVVVSSLKTGIFVIELNHKATGKKTAADKTSDQFYDTLFTKIFRYNMLHL